MMKIAKRPQATLDELGDAYRGFCGDGDARTRATRLGLMEGLIAPFREFPGGGFEKLTFGEFLDLNRWRVSLYEPEPRVRVLEPVLEQADA